MLYSPLIRKAIHIMFQAHKEDLDKGGYPYVFHPFYLASQMPDEDSTIVALLHDVLEDHGDVWSFEKLAGEGFNENVIEAVRLMTHDTEVPYLDYVRKLSANPIARRVKFADLKHNMDKARTDGQVAKKQELYEQALNILKEADGNAMNIPAKPIELTATDMHAVRTGNAGFVNQKGAKYYLAGNYTEAVEYYHLAAAMGDSDAISNLGYCYLYGRNIEQNTSIALAYFHIAAGKDSIDALYKLGDIYSQDTWEMKDLELSII